MFDNNGSKWATYAHKGQQSEKLLTIHLSRVYSKSKKQKKIPPRKKQRSKTFLTLSVYLLEQQTLKRQSVHLLTDLDRMNS